MGLAIQLPLLLPALACCPSPCGCRLTIRLHCLSVEPFTARLQSSWPESCMEALRKRERGKVWNRLPAEGRARGDRLL